MSAGANPNTSESCEHAVAQAYASTREAFEDWSTDPKARPYVVPEATAPHVGFTIFYTPVVARPDLLIIGQNPANFAGGFKPALTDEPNAEMLAGTVPAVNTYFAHEHAFARRLKEAFRNHEQLLRESVGMNVWHFQAVTNAPKAPLKLRRFCESTTAGLITALKPRAIMCIGGHAFDVVPGSQDLVVTIGRDVKQFDADGYRVVGLPHITGSYTWEACFKAMPIGLGAITEYLSTK